MARIHGDVVLSLFPGIGVLDRGFELEGFCVVRGPDALWGGDVRAFTPPPGIFAGVIGGPPCQVFSRLRNLVIANNGHDVTFGDLIPEYERVVHEAQPAWFLMENIPQAPAATVRGYYTHTQVFDNHWLGERQGRKRLIVFGSREDDLKLHIEHPALVPIEREWAVTGSHTTKGRPKQGHGEHRKLPELLRLQGLDADLLDHAPFTMEYKRKVVGNAVPLPLARAIARAVRKTLA